MTLSEILTELKTSLEKYIKYYDATSVDANSIVPLFKYFHSKNITLEDWNTLVRYVESIIGSDIGFDESIREVYTLLTSTVEDVQNNLSHQYTITNSLSKSVSAINTDLVTINNTLEGHTNAITNINTDISNLNTDVEDVQNNLSEAVNDLETYVDGKLADKFDKSGGVIDGDVTFKGNVNIEGTATTTTTQTLQVKDNIIMTNADGDNLVNLSGIAIRVNATDVYGIVYDIATDSVKLGLGKIVNNQFIFNENEGSPVATRTDSSSLTTGHLMQWNANSHRLEDSGIASSNVAKKNATPRSLNWTNANGVETSMAFNASVTLTEDNDLNDIKTYGIYQIYTNSTPLNTPSNIVQNAILVVLKSNLLPHCCQLFIGTSRYFIRYWTSVNWTSWQELAVGTKVPTIRSLNKDDNLNNLTEYAMYQIYYQSDVANLPKNLPTGLNTNSILNVYQVYSGNAAQVISTSNNELYIRYTYNSGTTWSAWTKMASESYVDGKINSAIITAINADY